MSRFDTVTGPVYCRGCRAPLSADAAVCTRCGHDQRPSPTSPWAAKTTKSGIQGAALEWVRSQPRSQLVLMCLPALVSALICLKVIFTPERQLVGDAFPIRAVDIGVQNQSGGDVAVWTLAGLVDPGIRIDRYYVTWTDSKRALQKVTYDRPGKTLVFDWGNGTGTRYSGVTDYQLQTLRLKKRPFRDLARLGSRLAGGRVQ